MKSIKEQLKGQLPCTNLEFDLIDWCYQHDKRIEELNDFAFQMKVAAEYAENFGNGNVAASVIHKLLPKALKDD